MYLKTKNWAVLERLLWKMRRNRGKLCRLWVIIGDVNVPRNNLLDSCPIEEQVQGARVLEWSIFGLLLCHFHIFPRKPFKTMVSPIFISPFLPRSPLVLSDNWNAFVISSLNWRTEKKLPDHFPRRQIGKPVRSGISAVSIIFHFFARFSSTRSMFAATAHKIRTKRGENLQPQFLLQQGSLSET